MPQEEEKKDDVVKEVRDLKEKLSNPTFLAEIVKSSVDSALAERGMRVADESEDDDFDLNEIFEDDADDEKDESAAAARSVDPKKLVGVVRTVVKKNTDAAMKRLGERAELERQISEFAQEKPLFKHLRPVMASIARENPALEAKGLQALYDEAIKVVDEVHTAKEEASRKSGRSLDTEKPRGESTLSSDGSSKADKDKSISDLLWEANAEWHQGKKKKGP